MWFCWFRRSIRKDRCSTRNPLRRRNNSRGRRYRPSSSPGRHRDRAAPQGEEPARTAWELGPGEDTAGPEEDHIDRRRHLEAAEEDNHPAEDNRPAEDSRPVGDSPAGEGSRPGDSTLGWTLLLLVFGFSIAQRWYGEEEEEERKKVEERERVALEKRK